MAGFVAVLVMLVLAAAAVAAVHFAHRATAVAPDPLRTGPFLSGHRPASTPTPGSMPAGTR